MTRLTRLLVLSASILLIGSVPTGAAAASVRDILRSARAAVVVPQEWDGIWTTVDSVYTCAGAFQSTSAGADTICGGKDYQTSAPGSGITFVCTGTATATTIDMTCTGSGAIFTDCNADYTIVINGTVSGNNFHIVDTINATYSGTGTGCNLLPPSCTQIDSWGTRTGPAPTAFCATPAIQSTWGAVKTHYR